jgi:hypothetical protein
MPYQMPVGRRALLRPFMVVAAWVCLLTQLSALTHFLIVEHVRCAEHGELIHAHDAHHSAPLNEHTEQVSRSQQFTASGDSDVHDHDHCLVSAERREASPGECFLPELKARQKQLHVPDAAPTHAMIAVSIYAFAPKTSPPV